MAERTTTAVFTGSSWDEKDVTDADRSPRLAHAAVVNDYSGGIQAVGTTCQYVLTYTAGGDGSFCGTELLTGSVDGREGSFAVQQRGTFDREGVIRCTFEVVPGSGTAALTGLTGTGDYEVREGEKAVEVAFRYRIDGD
ncbi:hypothetical protein AN217_27145 [Streptomyces qinglanensis]|uniref:DUF3224 domain-containing protein n=1 Tax=Streptomyces qinglanensis TaxID=943816 RepID=A0A1E7KAB1_9ACTN|nr:DUF3224 domain-containing protein [Streptomyces qinglanensis]OEV00872.1 hypothetical protein AN217_27145 [Streptomyces qinglanensis]OEV26069.1 hypothetical protein AN220_10350 [Streptomyces nanshensis]